MSGFHAFTIKEIPVFLSPWLLALVAYIAYVNQSLTFGLVIGVAFFLSILVHELGHAFVARRFSLKPQVMIHGMGGYCAHHPAIRDRDEALILAAGPGAGLALGLFSLAVYLLVMATAPGFWEARPLVTQFIQTLLYINIFWSLINLLPILPLDGGRLFRLLLLRLMKPAKAERAVYIVGAAIGVGGAILAFSTGYRFAAVFAGYFAWQNFQGLTSGRSSGTVRPSATPSHNALNEAQAALDAGDPGEAARLCHQTRDHSTLQQGQIRILWAILGIATERLGDHDDALSYLTRAQASPPVIASMIRCHLALGKPDAARTLTEHPAFGAIATAEKAELMAMLAAAVNGPKGSTL